MFRPVTDADVEDLARLATTGLTDTLIIEAAGEDGSVSQRRRVSILATSGLVDMIEDSGLVAWRGSSPAIDSARIGEAREIQSLGPLALRTGLEWLQPLSRMTIPRDLSSTEMPPEDLFEVVVFRFATTTLRFDGRRLGSGARAERAGDGLLYLPDGTTAIVYDCKAARDGYSMTADHERRFIEYVETHRSFALADGYDISHLMVISSCFSGRAGAGHPFHARARRIREATGVRLVYLKADHLVRIGIELERRDAAPLLRKALPWGTLLSAGIVARSDVDALINTMDT
jgi:hypothetical protein